jgi:hypothetical protein
MLAADDVGCLPDFPKMEIGVFLKNATENIGCWDLPLVDLK